MVTKQETFWEDENEIIKMEFEDSYCPEPNSGCWLWTKAINGFGYGSIWKNNTAMGAHRYSYELYVGEIPDGLYVCHRCDIRSCVNPNHLFLGTAKDNCHDMYFKGRDRTRGENHWQCKITDQQVEEIRNDSRIAREIAPEYGVSVGTVWDIKKGVTRKGPWKKGPRRSLVS